MTSSPRAKTRVQEIVLFVILLILIASQVVVYQLDQGTKRHGLSLDQAKLTFANYLHQENITISYLSDECYNCNETIIGTLFPGENTSYSISTISSVKIFIRTNSTGHTYQDHFREYALHIFNCSENGEGSGLNCRMDTLDEGDDAFLPILYAFILVGVLSITSVATTKLACFLMVRRSSASILVTNEQKENKNRILPTAENEEEPNGADPVPRPSSTEHRGKRRKKSKKKLPGLNANLIAQGTDDCKKPTSPGEVGEEEQGKAKRLISLDAVRGFSLVIMIFVNYGGGGYWFFSHSKWNGLTVADLVFPWFVWIMGVSLVFSFQGRKEESFYHQIYQIIRRTLILFVFGLFFISNNSETPIGQVRISGVLQRLALSYFFVAVTEVLVQHFRKQKKRSTSGWKIRDILDNWVHWMVVAVLEIIWLLLTFLVHDKQCPQGYLGPGGISDHGAYFNCTGGAAGSIDRWILGEEHMYPRATAKTLYLFDVRYEPEGILGTLNSIVLCFLGVQAGRTLLHFKGRHRDILIRFLGWGVALSSFGVLLCLGQKDEGLIPLNKNLWSLSYTSLLAGMGYLLLGVFYLAIDVHPLWTGAPFIYPGMNSILIYMGHEVLHGYFPFKVYGQGQTHLTYLCANLIAVSIWMLLAYYLFSVKFFFKI